MYLVFIHKKTNKVIDALPYPVTGGVTPNHGNDFYIVITDIVGNVGDDWSAIINKELPLLRSKYPATEHVGTDVDGSKYSYKVPGKYDVDGFCCEPWDYIIGGL